MKNALIYLIAFNIIAIPINIFFHSYGECKFLTEILGYTPQEYCPYVSNVMTNILYTNVLFGLMAFIIYGYTYEYSHGSPALKKGPPKHH